MTEADVERVFESIKVWKRRSERAPHKPLLLLLALAHNQRGGDRFLQYSDIESSLRELLVEFGPSRRTYHPELPFWHLQTDGVWTVAANGELPPRTGSSSPSRSVLLKYNAVGGFTSELFRVVRAEPTLISRIAARILESHFPQTIHEDILESVGLELHWLPARRRRNAGFRQAVLQAYEYRCAVCEFDIRVSNASFGLEAAHIRWHQAGGPDDISNGLALCVLHHKLFDLGAFMLDRENTVLVSELVHGGARFRDYLLSYHGERISPPQRPDHQPRLEHTEWHRRQVFKGRARVPCCLTRR